MINVNILNNIIKGITDQIPLVHSYYTVSPYDVWNIKDVQFGSVSFVITKVTTRQSTTTYDATIYYADRLLENNANRDSVYSDAATVIQTIVGALNQADDYLEVSYPVGITLFEQEFVEKTAGGYANLSISAKGMGECFEDDFTVPEIIATSAYFTKEQITELFPLRTQLATVAFSGSFNDLKDTPNLATIETVNGLAEAVVQSTSSLAAELNQKVSVGYFDSWADGIEAELSERVTRQDFNNLVEATETATDNLTYEVEKKFDTLRTDITDQIDTIRNDLDNKVGSAYFENWKDGIETAIEDAPTGQEFNAVLNAIDNLGVQVDNLPTRQDYNQVVNDVNDIKTDLDTRPTRQDYNQVVNDVNDIKTDLDTRPTRQDFNNLLETTETVTGNLAVELDKKVDDAYFETVKDNIEAQLTNSVSKQSFNNLYETVETVTGQLAAQINDKLTAVVFEEWKKSTDIENRVTQAQYDELFETVRQATSQLAGQITQCVSKAYFDGWADTVEAQLLNSVSQQQFDELIEATKSTTGKLAVEIENKFDSLYNAVETVTGQLATQIKDKLDSAVFYTFKTLVESVLDSKTNKQDFDNLYEAVKDVTGNLAVELDKKLDDNYFEGWRDGIEAELSERVTKQDFNNLAENIDYTREVLEEKLLLYESKILLYLQSDKFETALMDIVTPIILEYATTALDYYTRAEMDALLSNLNLEGYYTKEEIDAKLENLDLTEYYTKTEIDDKFTAIDDILNNVLYNY